MWLLQIVGGSAADGKVPLCVFNMHFFSLSPAVRFRVYNLLPFQGPIGIISPAMTAFIGSEMNAVKFPRNSQMQAIVSQRQSRGWSQPLGGRGQNRHPFASRSGPVPLPHLLQQPAAHVVVGRDVLLALNPSHLTRQRPPTRP